MTITEHIDARLKTCGMSRRQLAIKAGIPPSTFQSAMERGTNISFDMLSAVADALRVSPAVLMPDDMREAFFAGMEGAISTKRYRDAETDEEAAAAEKDVIDLLLYFDDLDAHEQEQAVACVRALANWPALVPQKKEEIEKLISFFNLLTPKGQQVAVERVEELTKIPDYRKTEDK